MKTKTSKEFEIEKVFKEAQEQTIETLPGFINSVMDGYVHDYNTIGSAIAAVAIAAATAANRHESGGITGFQAGFVLWNFIFNWSYENNKCGMKLLDYDKFLLPQYESEFERVISESTWEKLQEEAKERLENNDGYAVKTVIKHLKSVVDGNVPFGYKIKKEEQS
jgi:hypothetical protein